jgi:hypothetical protein
MTHPACPFLKFQTSNVRSPYRAHPICTSRFCALRFLLYARLPPGQSRKSRMQVERKLKMSSGRARSPSRVFNRPGRDIRLEEDGREARLLRSGIAVSQHEGWKAAPDSTQDSSSTRHPRPASDDAQADGISPKQVLKFAGYLVGSFREWKTAVEKGLGSPAAKIKELRVSLPDLLIASITLPNRVINCSYSRSET